MTFGYFISDMEDLLTMTASTLFSSRTCLLLNKLSKLPGSITETRKMKMQLRYLLIALLFAFLAVFASYMCMGWLNASSNFKGSIFCRILGEIATKTNRF